MDEKFWHDRWKKNDIGFHQNEANPNLVNNFHKLPMKENGRILLPLCGKTLDIGWLLSKGLRVVGSELSEFAIKELFNQLELSPEINERGPIKHYHAHNIDIFVGNIFELKTNLIGAIDAIYDRGAYVALPETIRHQYSQHLINISQQAPQLLVTYDYNQSLMEGPPFSISSADLENNYLKTYEISNLNSQQVEGGLKGICEAKENVWLLQERTKATT